MNPEKFPQTSKPTSYVILNNLQVRNLIKSDRNALIKPQQRSVPIWHPSFHGNNDKQ